MPLTREGTNVREYKIPAIYEAETTQQVKDIPRPVENAHAFLGTTTDGRLYKFDASSSTADDNFGTLQPSDTSWAGRWKLMPYGTAAGTGDFFNVKSFGATGDGTTDDSAAINAAIEAANSAGGGTVYFPYGTYRLLSAITSLNDRGVRLLGVYGDGLMTTGVGAVLVNDTGAAALNVNNAVVRGQSTVIERLAIIDGTTGGTYSIQLTGTYQVLVTNCAFETPLLLTSTRDTTIDHCYFTGTTGGYVQLSSAAIDTIIHDCNFDGSGGSSSCIASADSQITGLRLVNNQAVSLSGTFLGLTQSSNKVTNLHIEGNHITSISGETVPASKALIDLAGSFADAFDGVSIENNYFNWDAATYTWGIKGAYVNNSTFSNNRFDTAAITADISLDANSSNNYVVANGLTGSYSDAGTNNQFIDSSNDLMGNKTQDYINERQLSKDPVNAAVFDGSASSLANPDTSDLLVGGDATNDNKIYARFAIYIDDVSAGFPICGRYDSSKREWFFSVNTSGFLVFETRDDANAVVATATATTLGLESDRWYLVEVYYDGRGGETAAAGVTLRVNGNDCSVSAPSASGYVAMTDKDGSFRVGEDNNGGTHAEGRIEGGIVGDIDMGGNGEFDLVAPPEYQWGGPANYTSDFSGGTNGWTANQGTAAGNIDGIGGEDDTLRFTVNTSSSASHWLQRSGFTAGKWIEVTFDYYIPSTNSNIDGLGFLDTLVELGEDTAPTLDTWVTKTLRFKPTTSLFRVRALDGGNPTFTDPGGDDVFYIKNVVRKPIGALVSYQGRNVQSNGDIIDESSNQLDLTATSVTRLFDPQPNNVVTFTPTLSFPTLVTTRPTYTSQFGEATIDRERKLAHVNVRVALASTGDDTGDATLELNTTDFTFKNFTNSTETASCFTSNMTGLSTSGSGVTLLAVKNDTAVELYDSGATGNTSLTEGNFTATSIISFSATFKIE